MKIRGSTQILPDSIDVTRLKAPLGLPTSQLQDGATLLKADGTVTLTGNLPAGGRKLTGLGTPTAPGDSVSKAYADALSQANNSYAAALVEGLEWVYVLRSKVTTLSPQVLEGPVDGVNLRFILPSEPIEGSVCVFLNGLLQRPEIDYTVSGTKIDFTVAPIPYEGVGDWVTATFITA